MLVAVPEIACREVAVSQDGTPRTIAGHTDMPVHNMDLSSTRPRASIMMPAGRMADLRAALLLFVPFALMMLFTGMDFRLIGDETDFHVKIVEEFARTWPNLDLSNYRSASTPLAYVLLTAFGKVVGLEIWKLRMLTALATFGAAYLFYKLCARLELPHPLLSSLVFLFFPYIFFFGFTIYPENFGLLFGVWALSYYIPEEPSLKRLLKGSVLATLAIYCRQSYIVLPVGMLLYELRRLVQHGSGASTRRSVQRLALLAVPLFMFLPMLFLWGGFTSPGNLASQGGEWFLALTPAHLNYFLMLVGFYFLPMLLATHARYARKTWKGIFLPAAILMPVFIFFPVIFDEGKGPIAYAGGLIIHGLDVLRQTTSGVVASAAMLGLWMAGLIIASGEWARWPWSREKTKITTIGLTFAGLMTMTPFVYERYYILLIPLLLLLFHKSVRPTRLMAIWLGLQALLSAGFSYWQIALK